MEDGSRPFVPAPTRLRAKGKHSSSGRGEGGLERARGDMPAGGGGLVREAADEISAIDFAGRVALGAAVAALVLGAQHLCSRRCGGQGSYRMGATTDDEEIIGAGPANDRALPDVAEEMETATDSQHKSARRGQRLARPPSKARGEGKEEENEEEEGEEGEDEGESEDDNECGEGANKETELSAPVLTRCGMSGGRMAGSDAVARPAESREDADADTVVSSGGRCDDYDESLESLKQNICDALEAAHSMMNRSSMMLTAENEAAVQYQTQPLSASLQDPSPPPLPAAGSMHNTPLGLWQEEERTLPLQMPEYDQSCEPGESIVGQPPSRRRWHVDQPAARGVPSAAPPTPATSFDDTMSMGEAFRPVMRRPAYGLRRASGRWA